MKTSFIAVAALTAFAPAVYAQGSQQPIVYDDIHNATTIFGTWSTGSKSVKTGPGFANPANKSFTYPKNSGVSFSFSTDNYYEIARYRFNSNATEPNCIQGVVNWVHGKYSLLNNGSIVLTPLGDGYQQIQDPCAAISNFIEDYNLTELYQSWRIFSDENDGPKLHLFAFNGAPLAPMFQISSTPIMLPTHLLRNVTPPADTTSLQNNLADVNNGAVSLDRGVVGIVMALAGLLSVLSISL